MWDLPRPGIKPMSPAVVGEFFTAEAPIKASLKWEMERARQVLQHLLKEGLAGLDLLGARGDLPLGARSPLWPLDSQECTAEATREAHPWLGMLKEGTAVDREKREELVVNKTWTTVFSKRTSLTVYWLRVRTSKGGDTGSIPGLGRSHMLQSNKARAPQLTNEPAL